MITIYDPFITYLKNQEKNLTLTDKNLEKHHIIPLHDNDLKTGPIILCTSKHHTLAFILAFLRQQRSLLSIFDLMSKRIFGCFYYALELKARTKATNFISY